MAVSKLCLFSEPACFLALCCFNIAPVGEAGVGGKVAESHQILLSSLVLPERTCGYLSRLH